MPNKRFIGFFNHFFENPFKKQGFAVSLTVLTFLCVFIIGAASFFDETVYRLAQKASTETRQTAEYVTRIGKADYLLIPLFLYFIIAPFLYKKYPRPGLIRFRAIGAYLFLSVASTGLVINLLKFCIGKARPKLHDLHGAAYFQPFSGGYDFASLPSGHSGTAFAFAFALSYLYPKYALPFIGLAICTAATRMILGAHYLSDTIAGAGAAFLICFIMSSAVKRNMLLK